MSRVIAQVGLQRWRGPVRYEQTEVADDGRSGSNFARKAPAIRGPTVFWLVRSRWTCSFASMLRKIVLVLVLLAATVAT